MPLSPAQARAHPELAAKHHALLHNLRILPKVRGRCATTPAASAQRSCAGAADLQGFTASAHPLPEHRPHCSTHPHFQASRPTAARQPRVRDHVDNCAERNAATAQAPNPKRLLRRGYRCGMTSTTAPSAAAPERRP